MKLSRLTFVFLTSLWLAGCGSGPDGSAGVASGSTFAPDQLQDSVLQGRLKVGGLPVPQTEAAKKSPPNVPPSLEARCASSTPPSPKATTPSTSATARPPCRASSSTRQKSASSKSPKTASWSSCRA